MLKFCSQVDVRYQVLSNIRLVVYLDGDLPAHVLIFRCRIFIIAMRFVTETVRVIVNERMVPVIHWFQDFDVGLRIVSLVRRRVGERW